MGGFAQSSPKINPEFELAPAAPAEERPLTYLWLGLGLEERPLTHRTPPTVALALTLTLTLILTLTVTLTLTQT
jgi:hypothetical protein